MCTDVVSKMGKTDRQKSQRFKCYLAKPNAEKQTHTGAVLIRSQLVEVQLGRADVLLGPEYHGSWMTKGQGSEADMFMVILVPKVRGTRDVVKYEGWPGGIVLVQHEL